MELTILHIHQPIPVTLLHLQGKMDGSTGHILTQEVQRELDGGASNLLLDLTYVTQLNEAGAAALKKAAFLFTEGTQTPNPRVRLIHVRPDLQKVLDRCGLETICESCTNLGQALDFFKSVK